MNGAPGGSLPPFGSPPYAQPHPASRWHAAIAVLLPLVVYVYTAAPGVTLVDSGELALDCRTLGIAHAPGMPTYVLLGYLFSLLPLSADFARRTNLFSAVCAASTAGVSFFLIRELVRKIDDRIALAGALCCGFSLSLWSWAVLTEVYALNVLLVALTMLFAARGQWTRAAFAAGLALGDHHATSLMALPAAAYLLWTRRRPTIRDLVLSAGAMALALSVYLYIPLRAAQHPILNWGEATTPIRFWYHISGRQYRGPGRPSDSAAQFITRLAFFWKLWTSQMTVAGFLVSLAGLVALARRYRQTFIFTLLLMAPNILFIWTTGLGGPDTSGYYLPAFLAGGWCFAAGAAWIVESFAPGVRWAIPAVLLFALIPAVANFGDNNKHSDRLAPLYVDNTLRDVAPGSLIFTSDWNFTAPWLYRSHLENLRPAVEVVDLNLLTQVWYLAVIDREYPDLATGARQELAIYRKGVEIHEDENINAPPELVAKLKNLIAKLVEIKLRSGYSVYSTYHDQTVYLPNFPRTPRGLLFEFAAVTGDVPLDLSGLQGERKLDPTELDLRQTYAGMLTKRATYLQNHGDNRRARDKIDSALQLDPDYEEARTVARAIPPPGARRP